MPAETFKPGRTLRLTSPNMHGEDVRIVQRRLGGNMKIDGVYGPATASAVKAWKFRTGFPGKRVNTGLGVDGQEILFGQKPLPLSYRARIKGRARAIARHKAAVAAGRGLRDGVLNAARAYVGQKESPTGSNKVPALQDLARRLGLSPYMQNMGWPWCAYFVNLMMLLKGSKTAQWGLKEGKFNALYVPDILQHALHNEFGMQVISSTQVEAGDLVVMNFDGGVPDHIGIARGPVMYNSVPTREGNTGDISQSNGGEVMDKTRPLSEVQAFVRYI